MGTEGRRRTQGGEGRTIDGCIDALYFLCVQTCLIYIGIKHAVGSAVKLQMVLSRVNFILVSQYDNRSYICCKWCCQE